MNTHPTFRIAGVATLLAAGVGFAACDSSTAPATGTVAVRLTDAPFPTDSVQSVDIFVVRVDARKAAADSAGADSALADDSASARGWTTLAKPSQSVNLLAYRNGASLPLGQGNVATGSYLGFRLVIDPTKSSLTLKNGMVLSGSSSPSIVFPSGSRSGIKIVLSGPLVVAENDTTTLLVDFDVANSFVLRGNTILQNGLLFKPVVQGAVH